MYCPEINAMVELTGTHIGKYEVARVCDTDKYCIVQTQQIFTIDCIIARYCDEFVGDYDVYET